MAEERQGMDRRQFLRRAAATTAAAAWAAPIIQTVTASPAYANGTPLCDHSACIGACSGSGNKSSCGGPPGQVCAAECEELGNCGDNGEICTNENLCNPALWADCVFD